MKPVRKWIVPAISIFVFASGLLNIISAIGLGSRIRIRLLESILPWSVLSVSRSLTLISGVFLVILARGLWQKKKRAMRLSLVLLALSLILHLLKGLDFEEALALLLPLNLLIIFSGEFEIESSGLRFISALRNSLVILVFLFIYSVFGFYLFQGQFRQPVTMDNIIKDYEYSILGVGGDTLVPRTRTARWFDDSLTFVGISSIIFVFANLFAPVLLKSGLSKEDRDWVRDLVLRYGRNSVDYFALLDDKHYFFSKSRKSVIPYKVAADTAVVLSGPIGVSEDKKDCLVDFLTEMKRRGLSVVIYDQDEDGREISNSIGLKTMKIGEQAVIKTADFSLKGSERAEIRHAVARLEREGVDFRFTNFAQLPMALARDLEELHREWLGSKKIPPITFASDFFPLPVESEGYLLMAYSKMGKLLAAFSFLPYKNGSGVVLDLMLRSSEAFNGLMEGSIAYVIDVFKKMGKEEVSLSMAPLADVSKEGDENFISKGTRLIFKRFNNFYKYQSLFEFKKKFNPVWEHAYVAYEQDGQLPKVALALLRVNFKLRPR